MEIIAEKGADVFYRGSIGQDLINDIKDAGWCALTVGHVCTVGYLNSRRQKMSWDVAGGGRERRTRMKIVSCLILQGGTMDMEDLKNFKVRVTDAWKVPLGEADMHIAPPPAGGALVAFILKLMKGFKNHLMYLLHRSF